VSDYAEGKYVPEHLPNVRASYVKQIFQEAKERRKIREEKRRIRKAKRRLNKSYNRLECIILTIARFAAT